MIYHHKQQSGVIIILAVVLTGVLFSVAIALAVIVISDLRQAQSIDRSIVAYYAAESGLERSLFALRKEHDNPSAVDNMTNVKGLFTEDDLDSSESHWDINRSQDYEQVFSRQRLFRGQSVKIYITGRHPALVNNTKSINISWERGVSDIAIRLQAIMTQLQPQIGPDNALVYYTDRDDVIADDIAPICLPLRDWQIDDTIPTASPNDYMVELRSLGDTDDDLVENIRITTYESDDCSGDVYVSGLTNLTIVSDGDKDGAGQTIFAHIPPRDPISGILGFVLFSEEDITKGY